MDETDLKRRKLWMGDEKRGDSDPNIHTDEKQETENIGKSHYREAHGGYKELMLYPSAAGEK